MQFVGKNKLIFFLIGILVIGGIWYYAPGFFPKELKRIEQTPVVPPYKYYVIQDEATGTVLMYVSVVVVNVGDELVTDTGKWYRVVRVEGNIAYARQFEKQQDTNRSNSE